MSTTASTRRFGIGKFIFAVIFLSITALWFTWDSWNIDFTRALIIAPIALILVGIVGIIATMRRGNRGE